MKNCDNLTKEKKVKPKLVTDTPLCEENHLACGDGNCIERGLFCNGVKDCNDGSDENACGKLKENYLGCMIIFNTFGRLCLFSCMQIRSVCWEIILEISNKFNYIHKIIIMTQHSAHV